MRIEFACKDPAIERYVTSTFGPRFQRYLDHRKTAIGQQELLHRLNRDMAKEAAHQQWYDYTEGPEGREVILDEDGNKVLLVPEVRLVK